MLLESLNIALSKLNEDTVNFVMPLAIYVESN